MPTSTIILPILAFLFLLPGGLPAAEAAPPAAVAYGDPEHEPQPEGWPLTDPAEWRYVNLRFKERFDIALPGRYQAENVDIATGAVLPSSWMKQHATLIERLDALTSSPDIVLIGDSITQNWNNTALMGKSLAAIRPVPAWEEHFPNYLFFNVGQAGGSQPAALWRLKHGGLKGSHGNAMMDPKLAIVNLGVNPLIGSENYAQMAVGTRRVAEEVRRQFPKCRVLVLAVYPTARKAERVAPLNAAVATELKPLTDDPQSGIHYLDIGTQFLEADGVTLKEQYFHDRLHPNDLGYDLISRAIKPKVDELMRQAYGGRALPTVHAPADASGPRDTPLRVTFEVVDPAGSAADLHASAVSELRSLFSSEDLVVAGTGRTRTLTLTPKAGAGGSARVRIDVANALGQTARQLVRVHIGDPLPPLVVYGDGYQNGWVAKGGPDPDNTKQVHTGEKSLRVENAEFRIDARSGTGADIRHYRSVTLWVHGGDTGGQKLSLFLCEFKGPFVTVPLPPLPKGGYQKITIPLDAFRHAGGKELNGLMFKGPKETELFIDDIVLDPCFPLVPASTTPEKAAPAATRPLRIMPVGDSITEGSAQFSSYRQPLAQLLRDAGLAFEYVGRRGTGDGDAHEGYSGKNAAFLAQTVPSGFGPPPPDILLLHTGHNYDAIDNPIPQILAATEQLIQAFRKANPRGIVLLAQVIPSAKLPKYSYLPALNQELTALAQRLNSPTQRVVLVDQATGFDPATDTVPDLVHPSPAGAQKIARRWFQAMRPLLEAAQDTAVRHAQP